MGRLQQHHPQLLQEIGFERRVPTYDWRDEELVGVVEELVANEELAALMKAATAKITPQDPAEQAGPGRGTRSR